MYLSQSNHEGCNLHSLQLNLEGGKLFFLTGGKGPHEWPGYCHHHFFSLEVVDVLMQINPCSAMYGVIVGTKQDEDKYNFIFLIGAGLFG